MYIMNKEVSLPDQPLENVLTSRRFEVERYAALIRIKIEKQSAFFRVWNFPRIGSTSTCLIAAPRVFNLNHFCTHVSDHLGRVGRRNHVAVLDDPEACE